MNELVVDYIELVQVLVLNQILQLEMVSEDVRRLFQNLQRLHKQCRVELAVSRGGDVCTECASVRLIRGGWCASRT